MPDAKETLARIGGELKESFARNQRVMSFAEYLELFLKHPERQARSSAQYIKDVFDHYGAEDVRHPRGSLTRFKLFDAPFDEGRDRLVGQEEVQHQVYRLISNFVRDGQTNRLILLHGPNGSSKSTFVSCLFRALEHYSTTEEGALFTARLTHLDGRKLEKFDLPNQAAAEAAVAELTRGARRMKRSVCMISSRTNRTAGARNIQSGTSTGYQ